jgi:hypothetical protein
MINPVLAQPTHLLLTKDVVLLEVKEGNGLHERLPRRAASLAAAA